MTVKLSSELIGWLDFAITLKVKDATRILNRGWTEEKCIQWLREECEKKHPMTRR